MIKTRIDPGLKFLVFNTLKTILIFQNDKSENFKSIYYIIH